jgi:hypothetical protein
MSDVIILRGVPVDLDSSVGHQFITDATRAGEGVLTDVDVGDRYEIDDAGWESITKSAAVARAIRSRSAERVRSGQAAQELAAKIHAKAPTVLGDILSDKSASPRHRIESAKELRMTATGTANTENTGNNAEKFIITINLGADHVEVYEKEIRPVKELAANEINWGWQET